MVPVPSTEASAPTGDAGNLLPAGLLAMLHRTAGLPLVALAATPFALGALLWSVSADGGVRGPSLSNHAVINALGVPDPTCGATRAFILFAHGDARFLDYNPVWVFAALAMGAFGVIMTVRRVLGRPLLGRLTRPAARWLNEGAAHAVTVFLLLLAAGWLVAFLNLDAIRRT